ncbi:MAG: WG repeat-containing protein [Ruminiclostridium sp.]|nr:WG repeat-containing protein [Ruminiclostridium sp.]
MSKTCPSCKREIDDNIAFCNFCGAYAGEKGSAVDIAKVFSKKNIIIGISVFALVVTALLLIFIFDIFGLSKKEETLVGRGNSLFAEGLTPVAVSGKWGYADKNGEIVIAPTYEIALPFADKVNGLALVAVKDEDYKFPYYDVKYNYINEKGEIKIPSVLVDGTSFYTLTEAESFKESGYAKIDNNNFINSIGKKLFDLDFCFSYVSDFTKSGYAYMVYDTSADEYEEGEMIPISTSKAYQYQNDYYIIDKNGKELHRFSDFTDDGISDVFDEYFVYFRYAEGHDKELISPREFALADYESGKPVTEFYDRIFKSNDFYILCSFEEESCLYKAEIYDKDLNKLNDSYYTDNLFKAYDSGLVLYKKSGEGFERVLLNDSLQEICCENADVTIISGFDKSGIACVKEKNHYAGYSPEGKVFESKYPFGKMNCGLAPFLNDDGRIGFINIKGEIVLGAEYIAVSEFSADGYSTVFCDGSYRIIDTSGKGIINGLDYPINLIHGNGLDLKWYGNTDFTDNVRLIFDDDTISVAQGLFPGEKGDAFERDADYRLYDKSGKLISGKDSIISDYDSGKLGGFLEAVNIKGDGIIRLDRYGYRLVGKDGKVKKEYEDVRYIGVPDEYGVVCSKVHWDYGYDYGYHLGFNNPVQHTGIWYYTEADNGYYLAIGSGVSADVYDHNLNRVSVFPCNLKAEIDRGKVLFHRDVSYSFDWITEDVLNPARSYYVYDYYNGRRILRLDDTPSGTTSELEVTLTKNGFIFCEYTDMADKENILFSQDGKQIATNCEVVADNYKEMVLLKDLSDEKYYFVDRFGNRSEKYEYAQGFGADGYATVRKSDGKYYCIDTYYNDIFSSDKQFKGFCNGLAAFYDDVTGFIGYMDMSGKTVIEPRFHASSDFSYDGYAIAGDDYGGLYIVDKKGNTVIATDGFEGLDSARYINDRELTVYSRYSFENGYKYYLYLDFDEEKEKQFSYGLSSVGGSADYGNMRYLADMYGNLVYGPFEKINGMKLMPDGMVCFDVETGYKSNRLLGIDGRFIPVPENYAGELTVMDNGNIIINTHTGAMILDEDYNVIYGPCENIVYHAGYVEARHLDENVFEHFTFDEDMNPIDEPGGENGWYIRGHDLYIYDKSGLITGYGTFIAKSISKNEIVMEKYNCKVAYIREGKTTYIAVAGNGICTLYSYSEKDGLKVLVQDIFADYISYKDSERIIRDISFSIAEERYIYGEVLRTENGTYVDDSFFIYDIQTGKLINTEFATVEKGCHAICGQVYWLYESNADGLTHIVDGSGNRYLSTSKDIYADISDYLGFTIVENLNRGDGKGYYDFFYYKNSEGVELRNNFFSCQPFRKDGFATVSVFREQGERHEPSVIDMHGNIIY